MWWRDVADVDGAVLAMQRTGWLGGREQVIAAKRFAELGGFRLGDVSSLPHPQSLAASVAMAGVGGQPAWPSSNAVPTGPVRRLTACRLITGFGRVVMAEFDYQLQPVSSSRGSNKERWMQCGGGNTVVFPLGVLESGTERVAC